jgi:hypothetical protein
MVALMMASVVVAGVRERGCRRDRQQAAACDGEKKNTFHLDPPSVTPGRARSG